MNTNVCLCVRLSVCVWMFWFAANAIKSHRNRTCFEFTLVLLLFFSSNSRWECVILALQKQKQTKNRRKKSSKTRQCVHLNCQIASCHPLFYVKTLNFVSLLKIQIRFYFKELVFVHCVWNGIHFFRIATSFDCICERLCVCVLMWFCFLLSIQMIACTLKSVATKIYKYNCNCMLNIQWMMNECFIAARKNGIIWAEDNRNYLFVEMLKKYWGQWI